MKKLSLMALALLGFIFITGCSDGNSTTSDNDDTQSVTTPNTEDSTTEDSESKESTATEIETTTPETTEPETETTTPTEETTKPSEELKADEMYVTVDMYTMKEVLLQQPIMEGKKYTYAFYKTENGDLYNTRVKGNKFIAKKDIKTVTFYLFKKLGEDQAIIDADYFTKEYEVVDGNVDLGYTPREIFSVKLSKELLKLNLGDTLTDEEFNNSNIYLSYKNDEGGINYNILSDISYLFKVDTYVTEANIVLTSSRMNPEKNILASLPVTLKENSFNKFISYPLSYETEVFVDSSLVDRNLIMDNREANKEYDTYALAYSNDSDKKLYKVTNGAFIREGSKTNVVLVYVEKNVEPLLDLSNVAAKTNTLKINESQEVIYESVPDITKAIGTNNFKYDVYINGSQIATAEFQDGSYKYNNGFISYIGVMDNQIRITADYYGNGNYSYIAQSDPEFLPYFFGYYLPMLDNMDTDYIYYSNGQVKIDTLYKRKFIQNVLSRDALLMDYKITLDENDMLKSMKLSYTLEHYNPGISNIETVEFIFRDYGKAVVKHPDSLPSANMSEKKYLRTIAEAKKMTSGPILVEGVITSMVGNNFYIDDGSGSGSIEVYAGSNKSYNGLLYHQKPVFVRGDIKLFSNVPQIVNPIVYDNYNDYTPTEPLDFNSIINEENLDSYVGNIVNATGVVTELPRYDNYKNDYFMTIKIGNQELNVIVSKHLHYEYKNYFTILLDYFSLGTTVDLKLFALSKHKDYYELEYTSRSTIEMVDNFLFVECSKESYKPGTTVDEVLNNIYPYLVGHNLDQLLEKGEYEVNTDNLNLDAIGNYIVTVSYKGLSEDIVIEVSEPKGCFDYEVNSHSVIYDETLKGKFDVDFNQYNKPTMGLPSIGNNKVLVVPITYKDYPGTADIHDRIEKAFNGTSEETGYESLNTYYYKSSYGKLNIEATVLDFFDTNIYSYELDEAYKNYLEEFEKYRQGLRDRPSDPFRDSLAEILAEIDDYVDFTKYDNDNNQDIDVVYFVNTAPELYGAVTWWAHNAVINIDMQHAFDGKFFNNYISLSADSFYEPCGYTKAYGERKLNYIYANARTLIHETGHALGLLDYYDTDQSDGNTGGLGYSDMMDGGTGDHNMMSKALLGWVDPTIVDGVSTTITLGDISSNGGFILIPKKWKNTILDEFYMIEYYEPTGLFERGIGLNGSFNIPGVKIYHIDFTKNFSGYNYNTLRIYLRDNDDPDYRMIELIEADGNNSLIKPDEEFIFVEDSDLFQQGDKLVSPKWSNSTPSNFTISIDSIKDHKATISISFN